jgi:hypothetical protein
MTRPRQAASRAFLVAALGATRELQQSWSEGEAGQDDPAVRDKDELRSPHTHVFVMLAFASATPGPGHARASPSPHRSRPPASRCPPTRSRGLASPAWTPAGSRRSSRRVAVRCDFSIKGTAWQGNVGYGMRTPLVGSVIFFLPASSKR